MLKYRFAKNSTNKVVDAFDLPKDRAGLDKQYACIGCGQPVIAKTKGEKRVKHFAHATDQLGKCCKETYLHKLGKAVFRDTFIACREQKEPFEIRLFHTTKCMRFSKLIGGPCESQVIEQTHDLTNLYDDIREEQQDGSFIPDLFLTKRGKESRRLYIEIAVTHFASEGKRNSGNPIIEISISSEDDLEKIRRRKLTASDAEFINFQPKPVHLSNSKCICVSEKWNFFRVFRSGNCHMLQLSPSEIEATLLRDTHDIAWWGIEPFGGAGGSAYVHFVEKAALEGAPIRNCFICKYAGRNFCVDPKAPVFCRFLKKKCRSTQAVECRFFRRKDPEQQPASA